eukprot:TRINITY_DN8864_c0_g1_i1.p1 TRINITY_DN8864_c0_g1~~TRINITY_DN8864_c0_g1_i1.p1  ORF type:complete len:342 (-),score=29.50 TRINITY_DN8864_c0_g1_i1:68-1093(-)
MCIRDSYDNLLEKAYSNKLALINQLHIDLENSENLQQIIDGYFYTQVSRYGLGTNNQISFGHLMFGTLHPRVQYLLQIAKQNPNFQFENLPRLMKDKLKKISSKLEIEHLDLSEQIVINDITYPSSIRTVRKFIRLDNCDESILCYQELNFRRYFKKAPGDMSAGVKMEEEDNSQGMQIKVPGAIRPYFQLYPSVMMSSKTNKGVVVKPNKRERISANNPYELWISLIKKVASNFDIHLRRILEYIDEVLQKEIYAYNKLERCLVALDDVYGFKPEDNDGERYDQAIDLVQKQRILEEAGMPEKANEIMSVLDQQRSQSISDGKLLFVNCLLYTSPSPRDS